MDKLQGNSGMKIRYLLTALLVASCARIDKTENTLAQCQLDSNGSAGIRFQREYVSFRQQAETQADDAYHAFILLCMKSKGFNFERLFSDELKPNEICWRQNRDFADYSLPFSSNPACYSKSWW